MTAPNVQAPGEVGTGRALRDHENTDAAIVALDADACNEKLTANLVAAFALRGHSVYELAGGGFAVTRWGLVKTIPDLRTLQAFGRQVGVQA